MGRGFLSLKLLLIGDVNKMIDPQSIFVLKLNINPGKRIDLVKIFRLKKKKLDKI